MATSRRGGDSLADWHTRPDLDPREVTIHADPGSRGVGHCLKPCPLSRERWGGDFVWVAQDLAIEAEADELEPSVKPFGPAGPGSCRVHVFPVRAIRLVARPRRTANTTPREHPSTIGLATGDLPR